MSIDDALNTLARKFSTFDDLKEMGNYYIKECKQALLEIIIGEKPPKKEEAKFATGDFEIDIKTRGKIEGFNQGADEYEKKITALFNKEA